MEIAQISEMGNCGSNRKEEDENTTIELSFRLNRSLPHPNIGMKQFVIRDGIETSRVDGLSNLLDDLDDILEVI